MRPRTRHGLPIPFMPVLAHWVLRILVELEGHRLIMNEQSVTEPWALALVGPEDFVGGTAITRESRLGGLRKKLKALEVMAPRPPKTTILMQNITWLQKSLGLCQVERDIVAFLTVVHHCPGLEKLLERFGALRTHEINLMLATILGVPQEEVTGALRHGARLVTSGLVWVEPRDRWAWTQKIGLLDGIGDLLALDHADPAELFASNFVRSDPPALLIADFPHLTEDLTILLKFFEHSMARGSKGVNCLLYGPPGTGKTELARAIAAHLGVGLFEVAVQDRAGDPIKGEARLGAFQLAQGVLAGGQDCLLLFDEVEDVFRPYEDEVFGPRRSNRSGRKGFINRLLTQGPVPSIWITNAPNVMDPAYLRRFDLAVEVGVPPRTVRERIVIQHTSMFPLPSSWRARVAEHEHLTPAAIEKAARVTQAVLATNPIASPAALMGRVLDNTLAVLGAPSLLRLVEDEEVPYRPELLNADRDLDQLVQGLLRRGSGRLCLYGPPGTGKSAWGRHLARVLDRPLHVHHASDLLSAYVGETEQKIARMFRQAQEDGALLQLDEADSFFRDRSDSNLRGWEVTQVNEMLTGTEGFGGIFVASTNLMDRLDAAVLRRFDFKIHFGFLAPHQAARMLPDCLKVLGVPVLDSDIERVQGLAQLTPGDFATVMRQAHMDPIPTGEEFVRRLGLEVCHKGQPPRRPLGFGSGHGRL